jgi:hypothetical protein
MNFPCTLKRLANGQWSVRHAGLTIGTVEVTARTSEEALVKMRNELRYRVELCLCSGVSDDTIKLEVTEDLGPSKDAQRNCAPLAETHGCFT